MPARSHMGDERRFTPTCVGKSYLLARTCRRQAVHPHVCGEIMAVSRGPFVQPVHPHVCGEIRSRCACCHAPCGSPPRVWGNTLQPPQSHAIRCGSPPRVWGNRRQAPASVRPVRFTPTCVGKSCGLAPVRRTAGSPPRVWGNLEWIGRSDLGMRFTPTCVGKSRGRAAASDATNGSPPRVWGNHALACPDHSPMRFTPTCVGKSYTAVTWPLPFRFTPTCVGKSRGRLGISVFTVHPHVCGEIGMPSQRLDAARRFTPTCVGKSYRSKRSTGSQPVHPHVCGEI